MDTMLPFSLLVIALMYESVSSQGSQGYMEEAIQIFNTIFHKYEANVPPRRNLTLPLLLNVNMHVMHVSSLNLLEQYLETTIDLELTWDDMRLSWFPLNVREITANRSKVWSPDISIDNAIDEPKHVDDPRIVIKSTGTIYWYKRLKIKTSCSTNATQVSAVCDVVIGSNLLDDRVIDFNMSVSSCDAKNAVTSHILEIEDVSFEKRKEVRWLKPNATFPEFACSLRMKLTGPDGTNGQEFLTSSHASLTGSVTCPVLSMFVLSSCLGIIGFFSRFACKPL
ncbi:neuronal acetylcholine receptor subunit alpha-3-like isoform X2 [Dreissena polymorpha]|uniref:neuronal acetylcholine receptor subunit alpha-3-like isoform X2 n=1 Tax=Dreissena polymorpha TaxID=45954 RepID=UPI002264D3B2|nr:neuronal acetylcholine receptor subunit alpha-3-like isoform X2 [Dreissena polymorpha]